MALIKFVEASDISKVIDFVPGRYIICDNGDCYYDPTSAVTINGEGVPETITLTNDASNITHRVKLSATPDVKTVIVENPNLTDNTLYDVFTTSTLNVNGNADLPNDGDVLIVKKSIGDSDKFSYTSYHYESSLATEENPSAGFVAMDGNYSADNVYLSGPITLAGSYTTVGNVKLSDNTMGNSSTSITDILTKIFTQELNPTVAVPSISLTGAGAVSGVEVGTSYSMPSATLKITGVGTYSYGSANKNEAGELINVTTGTGAGVPFIEASITVDQTSDTASFTTGEDNNNDVMTLNETLSLQTTLDNLKTESMKNLVITDSTITYKFSASAKYPAFGSYPSTVSEKYAITNLKNEVTATNITNYNTIKTGKTLSTTANVAFSGFRNYWYGFINTSDYTKIARITDSSDSDYNKVGIAADEIFLTAGGAAIANGSLPTLTCESGDVALVVLTLSSANKSLTGSLPDSLNAPFDFTKHSKALKIHGLNGYTTADYDVHIYAPAEMPAGTRFDVVVG